MHTHIDFTSMAYSTHPNIPENRYTSLNKCDKKTHEIGTDNYRIHFNRPKELQ